MADKKPKLYYAEFTVNPYQKETANIVARDFEEAQDELVKAYPDNGKKLAKILCIQYLNDKVIVSENLGE